jgi:ATP-dependent helicase/nuclease subunit B
MEDYAAVLHRTFRRHNIPFFTDHRELMAHHPVAELTRRALRLVALGGRHDDWIAALKTGLIVKSASFVDYLENVTLARVCAKMNGRSWRRNRARRSWRTK